MKDDLSHIEATLRGIELTDDDFIEIVLFCITRLRRIRRNIQPCQIDQDILNRQEEMEGRLQFLETKGSVLMKQIKLIEKQINDGMETD